MDDYVEASIRNCMYSTTRTCVASKWTTAFSTGHSISSAIKSGSTLDSVTMWNNIKIVPVHMPQCLQKGYGLNRVVGQACIHDSRSIHWTLNLIWYQQTRLQHLDASDVGSFASVKYVCVEHENVMWPMQKTTQNKSLAIPSTCDTSIALIR